MKTFEAFVQVNGVEVKAEVSFRVVDKKPEGIMLWICGIGTPFSYLSLPSDRVRILDRCTELAASGDGASSQSV